MSFATAPTETALRLMHDRGIKHCEVEGCENPAVHAHHAIYKKSHGKHPVKELDMDENLQLVCYSCHMVTGVADGWENRLAFWGVQCERFGHDWMVKWHTNLKLKCKEKSFR